MENPLVSIITIVNDKSRYEGFTESLETQNFKAFELIPVMNMAGELQGAREGLRLGASKASGKFLLFSHPDIRFQDADALGDFVNAASEISEFGVVGAAGAAANEHGGRDIVSSICQGDGKTPISDLPCGRTPSGAESVQTVDECFFMMDAEYYREHPFPERKGWHLYAVEACLSAIKNGMKNYVVPARLWHMSDGKSLDPEYVKQVKGMCKDEKRNFDVLHTTVKSWKTRGIGPAMYRNYYQMKQSIKKALKK